MPRRIQAEARYVEGVGFLAHDPATGQPIKEYTDFNYGAGAQARDQQLDDIAEAVKTFKVGVVGAARLAPDSVDKAARIPCWVTVPD